MANYNILARSNYFSVKDVKEFTQWTNWYGGLHTAEHDKNKGTYALLVESYYSEFGGAIYGTQVFDDEGEDVLDENGDLVYEEINLLEQLAEHLVNDEVAIFMEIGYEKLRYLTGRSFAVNSKGETKIIDINDIYEQAKELGNVTNEAVY